MVFLGFSIVFPQVYQLKKEVPHKIGKWIQPQLNHEEDRLTIIISLNLYLDNMTTTANVSFHNYKEMNL